MIINTYLKLFKINKKILIAKALLLILIFSLNSIALEKELKDSFDIKSIINKYKNEITQISTKSSKLSVNRIISISDILKEYLKSDIDYSIEIEGEDSTFTFSKNDFIDQKKETAFLVLDKVKSKLESVDSVSISDKNGKLDFSAMDELFSAEATQKMKIGPNKLSKADIKKFFNNKSIIFIQDFNTERWIKNPKTIKIYKK